jgi:hypothetical protein
MTESKVLELTFCTKYPIRNKLGRNSSKWYDMPKPESNSTTLIDFLTRVLSELEGNACIVRWMNLPVEVLIRNWMQRALHQLITETSKRVEWNSHGNSSVGSVHKTRWILLS